MLGTGHARHEHVRVLFLSAANGLLHDEVMFHGCIDQCSAHVRPIVARAFDVGAARLIIAHNHPSGAPEPSSADIEFTRSLVRTSRALAIEVIDHIIVARGKWSSMHSMGLL